MAARSVLPLLLPTLIGASPPAATADESAALACDVRRFEVVRRHSGDTDYYRVLDDGSGPFLRAEYPPPADTTVLGFPVPEADRRRYARLRWRWRALRLPMGGNECEKGKGDSAAAVYATWRRGLRWYTVKFVWSSVAPRYSTCAERSGVFAAQAVEVLESGGPLGAWRGEQVDLDGAFRRHFEGGDPAAEVPDLIGLGVMTDGDQTGTPSAADYADFVLSAR